MGVFYESIPPSLASWILEQKIFWIATAPLSAHHHINLSPKGGASGSQFGLRGPNTFWYLDRSGSGAETLAHLRENGRVTVQFCAFTGPPKIVRLWGRGQVLERGTREFRDFVAAETESKVEVGYAARSVIVVDVHQVGSSCGFAVPYFEWKGWRRTLDEVFERKAKDYESGKSKENMDRYWAYKSAWSVDGLPAMQRGLDTGAREGVAPMPKMIGPYAPVAPFGPKSGKLSAQIRHSLAMLEATRISLVNMLLMVLIAFMAGVLVTLYVPHVVASQKGFVRSLIPLS